MPSRAPYYPIAKGAYLFTSTNECGELRQPEEEVRQWCAFELIRAYGYSVADLTFEHEVKVGSKSYRIDILVKRNGAPWIVVECKEPKHKKPTAGLEQAVSYAGSQSIRAEFAVYTNGSDWKVNRRVDHRWVAVVDIPSCAAAESAGSIDDLLHTLQKIQPVLHKLDERIEGDEARSFLAGLQIFFHGPNLLTSAVDNDLRFGSDCLLRVLSTGADNQHYARSKISAAADLFEKFRLKSDVGHPLAQPVAEEHIGQYMPALMGSMAAMIDGSTGEMGIDAYLVRLNIALLDYGRTYALTDGAFPAITPQVNEALRGFLSYAFATRLDIRLPSSLDAVLTSDMKSFCRPAWEALMEDEKTESREARRDLVAGLFSWLMFWRRGK